MRKELEEIIESGKDIYLKDIETLFESQEELDEFLYKYKKKLSTQNREIPELSSAEKDKYLKELCCCSRVDTVALQVGFDIGYIKAANILERLVIDGYLLKIDNEKQNTKYSIKDKDATLKRIMEDEERGIHDFEEMQVVEDLNTGNKLAVTMEDVLQKYASRDIIKKGNVSFCICPFKNHQEKTPSFSFRPDSFNCFGCGKSGNVTQFVSILFDITEEEAAKKLKNDFE